MKVVFFVLNYPFCSCVDKEKEIHPYVEVTHVGGIVGRRGLTPRVVRVGRRGLTHRVVRVGR